MTNGPVVHVLDDDESVRLAIASLLASVGLEARTHGTTQAFLAAERPDVPGCLVLDVRLPGTSGLDLQTQLAERGVELPVILITGHGDIPMSVRGMKAGAVDFLAKPFREQDLLDAVAGELGISEITVKIHRGAAMKKMGARTLPDLVRMQDALSAAAPRPADDTFV